MNEQLRKRLIEIARTDKFISYSDLVKECALPYDLQTEKGRNDLSVDLGQISSFENSNDRPLLSSLAIYKDAKRNDHGDGFYRVAESLGKGSFKVLKDKLYGFSEAEKCRKYWQDVGHYEKEFGSIIVKQKTITELFILLTATIKDAQELENNWAKPYQEFVNIVVVLKNKLQGNRNLSLDDEDLYADFPVEFNSFNKFMRKWWFQMSNGISSRGQSVLYNRHFDYLVINKAFLILAREVILHPTEENHAALTDWWYANPNIDNRPLLINRALAACNATQLTSTVDRKKFKLVLDILKDGYGFIISDTNYNSWYKSNTLLTTWLDIELSEILNSKYEHKSEQDIWRNIFVWLVYAHLHEQDISPNTLTLQAKPNTGLDAVPEATNNFKGYDAKDYLAEAKQLKDLGNAGENLVIAYEKKKVIAFGFDPETKVRKAKDGEGFDILSCDNLGNPIYIEVKTTSGNSNVPFYLSSTEVSFMRINATAYVIYRVYNYDEEYNCGEFYILKNDVESQLLLEPKQYKVYLKKQ